MMNGQVLFLNALNIKFINNVFILGKNIVYIKTIGTPRYNFESG
ncbi:hypothetical protein BTN50_1456 [Candidatus Enterovibrio altilux]|uniref:Uncharacterized protein n=1 Tax=Candidatus Enterovibrio altilux TaxID=1927128 RepID=A0A291BAA3_9GAMM|nr:hypothetical protein BTN50_1456 [Candidatus Enterovibrio luxaltus]